MIDYKLFDWSKIYWIDIKDIKYGFDGEIRLDKDWGLNYGKISNEDFKKLEYSKNNITVNSMKQFLFDNVPITHTKLFQEDRYQNIIEDLKNGVDNYNNKTVNGFIKNIEKKWKAVYHSIKNYGLKSQKQLSQEKIEYLNVNNGSDEIAAVIDQDGKLLFFNGNHRIACAIILGINKIPVKIAARHQKWVDFILGVRKFNTQCWKASNKTYQTIDHVDFRDFQPEWSPEYRYNQIKGHLELNSGTLLDIGALWGDFCHKFEDNGFNCTAVERDARMIDIMRKMKIAKDKKFNIILNDIFNLDSYNYDVVLALNIFHHFLISQELHDKLGEMIFKFTCKEMYFQSHNHKGELYNSLYRNYTPEEFVNFILKNSKYLNSYKEIGEERGRKLFKLYRSE